MPKLIPIEKNLEDNIDFINHSDCQSTLKHSVDYFKKIGYDEPWIGYYLKENERYLGNGAFKGKPKDNKVEIAYVTFEEFRKKGVGSMICKLLVEKAIEEDKNVIITARTLRENNPSTKILKKNGFVKMNDILDEDGVEVWEWVYAP